LCPTPRPRATASWRRSPLGSYRHARGGSENEARAYLKALYAHTPFLDSAARSTGVAFAVEKKGDVHLAWENEPCARQRIEGQLEIVYPPISILAEPTVAWVDVNVTKHNSASLARAYLDSCSRRGAGDTRVRAIDRSMRKSWKSTPIACQI